MVENAGTNAGSGQTSQGDICALLAEYEHCAADIRSFDSMLWQIPTVGAVALYALAYVVSINKILGPELVSVVLLMGVFLMLALTVALHKNRFFQMARVKSLAEIRARIAGSGINLYGIPITTCEVTNRYGSNTDIPKGWWYRQRAYTCLQFSMFALFLASSLMFLWSLNGWLLGIISS